MKTWPDIGRLYLSAVAPCRRGISAILTNERVRALSELRLPRLPSKKEGL